MKSHLFNIYHINIHIVPSIITCFDKHTKNKHMYYDAIITQLMFSYNVLLETQTTIQIKTIVQLMIVFVRVYITDGNMTQLIMEHLTYCLLNLPDIYKPFFYLTFVIHAIVLCSWRAHNDISCTTFFLSLFDIMLQCILLLKFNRKIGHFPLKLSKLKY